ncbi:SCO family protein [Neobacillus thermocopriae]|uniref:SCO family protein n=1 Tax=Neobacillus thermocopriae TaxID=1215031 RepID=A0A6B3TWT1_9BACI|nr:SCO family protein [Neobacillus thermocopriae]MED3625565.1 SCO family protein [Neobacillus thermocopriae]MED3715414.1 SCO family protein [Neobacillus thermocopriae]NEX80077.1 SCO family protein [Neobacillus thermocopriae]
MKKIYIICSLVVILGIAAGITFFLIRDANMAIPEDITLINQNRESYTFGNDRTKLKLIEFIYTNCPDVCPTTTVKMAELKNELIKSGDFGNKIKFITITIDPYNDTPEKLLSYMKAFGIENSDSWIFLTGEKENIKKDHEKIRRVAESLQFQYKDPGNGQFVHTTFTYLVDENNNFIAKFPMGKDFNKKEVYNKIKDKMN